MILYIDTPLDDYLQKVLLKATKGDNCLFKSDLKGEDARKEALLKADIVFGNPPPSVVEQSKNLKWMQLYSAGFDAYRGLKTQAIVTNMHDYFSEPCAETAIAGILALYRGMDKFTVLKNEKTWVGYTIRAEMQLLAKKQVLILGAGNIAQKTAKILRGFDAKVHFYARTQRKGVVTTGEEVKSLIPKVDVIIACLPGTQETKGFFTTDMLNLMKPTALFCNVGRGSLVADEYALAEALKSGKIGGAVLDVTVQEPIPTDHPFWECPNTVLSQHSAGGDMNEYKGLLGFFLKNLKRYKTGKSLLNRIELGRGY
jgi:phosphoglycerate dehydrogenase-like enzyme